MQISGLEQHAIGRYQRARGEQHDIAGHDALARNGGLRAIAKNGAFDLDAFAEPREGWTVNIGGSGSAEVSGPGVRASVHVSAGVGDLDVDLLRETQFGGGTKAKFAGHDALRVSRGFLRGGAVIYAIPYRRRTLILQIRADRKSTTDGVTELERLLAPTLAE